MGVIKDGTVSGFLPDSEAFAVFYPAYPSSTSRAIETLGGSQGLVKTRSLSTNKLEFRFRPEDPYSHPAFGELQPCNNLLLKISKKKPSEPKSSEIVENEQKESYPGNESTSSPKEDRTRSPGDVQTNLYVDVVSRVSEAYHFNGMVDYQHVVAVHADDTQRKKRTWEDMEPYFDKGGLADMEQDNLMTIVPPLFSPKDKPENLVLRPSSMMSSKKLQEGDIQQRPEMISEANYFMDFTIKEIPKKTDWTQYIPQGSAQWEWQMVVARLFEERPIWPKGSVVDRLRDNGIELGHIPLKRLLLGLAYYFSNGPFFRFWIRKGYDPRKDPESRIYQRVDFRVPPSLQSYCNANKANSLKHEWQDLCALRVFPLKCHTTLQFFELQDEYIQQEIRKPSKQKTCTRATGWFSDPVMETLKARVLLRFISVYPKPGAEKELKSAIERFDKSKKMLIANVLKTDAVNNSQVNKEANCDKDKEESRDYPEEREDIEVDDEEEEEEEEEIEADEALRQVDDANEFLLQQGSHIEGEDISRSYLQELFGSFPSMLSAANKTLDTETSDGEYQIYDHNSDVDSAEDDD